MSLQTLFKLVIVGALRTLSIRLFQEAGPATANTRLPSSRLVGAHVCVASGGLNIDANNRLI